MSSKPLLIAKDVILRPMVLADSEKILKYRSNKIVNQFQGWIPCSLEEVEDFIENKISCEINKENTWYQFVILTKAENELIGDLGIHFISSQNKLVEIGITIDEKYQRRGYASEALKRVINFLFNDLGKHRIICSIDPRNTKSEALVKRLGFRKEAHFKKGLFLFNEWVDDMIYALLNEEWEDTS